MNKFIIAIILLIIPSIANAIENGEKAPNFELNSFSGDKFSLSEYQNDIVVLEWTNPGCPFVKKHYQNGNMQKLQKKYREKGVVWVSINSTTSQHQDYLTKEAAKKNSEEWKIDAKFMLDDHKGTVGKLFQAKSTPHMFILNKGILVYQGAIDSNPDIFENNEEKTNYVVEALDSLLASEPIRQTKTPPYGCGVKYQD